MAKQYETVIGLEVHVELATRTKIFCGCSTRFGAKPNTQTCPVCAGFPGALPVLNKKVLEYALSAGLALNCEVNRYSRFDRKNYFYPDNPQNYQISQLYLPICHDGWVEIDTGAGKKKIRIHEIHMEEDAGKLIHDEWGECSLVDFNRSGVPLIEIVSEPDMRSAGEVIAYLEKLRDILQYLKVSDCKLQEGSMRADVNLSVREVGSEAFGVRTEMKNLNSFKAIAHAVEGERERQIELLEEGKAVLQETRRWDENKESSRPMRSKEDAKDYRYFPDPDLPPVTVSEEWLNKLRESRPMLREERKQVFAEQYGLTEYDASVLTVSVHMADLFEETAKRCGNGRRAAAWLMGEAMRLMKEDGLEPSELSLSPENLARLIRLEEEGRITPHSAKRVFAAMVREGADPDHYIEENGLAVVRDEAALEEAVRQVLAANPGSVEEFRGGKEKVFSFLMGQVMRQMKGKADAGQVREMLQAHLGQTEKKL